MVSPQNALASSFDNLRRVKISPQNYQGALSDVVFDMVTADSFVAGVADHVISGQQIPHEHRDTIAQELLRGNACVSQAGDFDLTPYPELLEYARTIDETRQACLRASSQ